MKRANIMHDTVSVGDAIICDGDYSAVTQIRVYEAGESRLGPVRLDMRAVEYVTDRGSRWRGLEPAECVCPPYAGPSRFGAYMQACRDKRPDTVVWCACIGWR